ncbi:MAG TPA: ABC transporter permease, partial [Puia sp.]|nr:ABC transporter permease [Puia sp.]
MLNNYYKTAVRAIARSRFHALLNILSLATGISFTLLIGAYTWEEWSVNHRVDHPDRQYILTTTWKDPNIGFPLATFGPLAKTLKEQYPSLVANYFREDGVTSNVSLGDRHFRENLQIADSTLLPTYGFPLTQGDARTALNEPFSVVITEETANKYFGRTDVVGRDLTIENFSGSKKDFRITGVMKTPSMNSVTSLIPAYPSRIFVPSVNLSFFNRNMDWQNIFIGNFIELQPGVSPEALQPAIAQVLKTNAPPGLVSVLKKVNVVSLHDFYFSGAVRKMIYTLTAIAFFILLMAVINFVNLSVSRSTARMKEIGIRKVLGGIRGQLIRQFLTESVVLSVMATLLALALYQAFAPSLAAMLGRNIPALWKLPAFAWIIIGALALVVGVLAGLYPAFVLSSLSSVDSLKGRKGAVKENILFRKILVGFQFGTATFVLVGAIIVSQQIRLFFSDQLGYDKDYVVSAQLPRDWSPRGVQRMESVRQQLARLPQVKDVALSYEIPDGNNSGSIGTWREGSDSTRAIVARTITSDEYYSATYGIPMLTGDFFNKPGENPSQDSTLVVINETAAKAYGWKDPHQALGQRIHLLGFSDRYFTVSGITKDFYFGGMGAPIDPHIFVYVSLFTSYRYFSIKLRPGNIGESMAVLQRQWASLLPGAPFEYKFMD